MTLEINQIYNEDCLAGMARMESDSVDLIVTDPPYFVLEKQEWDMQWKSLEEYMAWFDKVFAEMWRVLKDGGQLYSFFSQKYMNEYFKRYSPKRMLVWWHRNLSQPTNDMWLYQYDPIFYHVKGDKPTSFNGHFAWGYNSDVLEYPKPQRWEGTERYHPSEKNLKSIFRIISISSEEGDTVLDPFMGSGTTAVAAVQANRQFIGFEKEPKYADVANRRIGEIQKQAKLWR